VSRVDDDQWALVKQTIGASRAVELLAVLGLEIKLGELADARRRGRVATVKVGDVYRFDVEELERFANAELARSRT
jgi:hypothetical protein